MIGARCPWSVVREAVVDQHDFLPVGQQLRAADDVAVAVAHRDDLNAVRPIDDRPGAAVRQLLHLHIVGAVEQASTLVGHVLFHVDVAAAEIDDDAAAALVHHVAATVIAVVEAAAIAAVAVLVVIPVPIRPVAVLVAILLLRLLLRHDGLHQLVEHPAAQGADAVGLFGVALPLELLLHRVVLGP